jgi:hypothetical protein
MGTWQRSTICLGKYAISLNDREVPKGDESGLRRYGPTVEIEAKEVAVLICDEGLIRKCAFCGNWENIDNLRFLKVGMDNDDPLYWSGSGVSSFFS